MFIKQVYVNDDLWNKITPYQKNYETCETNKSRNKSDKTIHEVFWVSPHVAGKKRRGHTKGCGRGAIKNSAAQIQIATKAEHGWKNRAVEIKTGQQEKIITLIRDPCNLAGWENKLVSSVCGFYWTSADLFIVLLLNVNSWLLIRLGIK